MKILWLTWKDKKHPQAGGAEVVNEELAKRLVKDGHEVVFLVGGFNGGESEEMINGYKVIRLGNRWSVYWQVYRYYKTHFSLPLPEGEVRRGWERPDLVIDEVNTIPFFAKFYAKEKNILFIHQLCRQIWFYQMFFPLSLIGYLIEPLYLRLLSDRQVITVSESTKKDLMRFGFRPENISIISEGIEMEPVESLEACNIIKYERPTVLALGSVRAMKRTGQIVQALAIAKEKITDLELIIAGDAGDNYGRKVMRMVEQSKYKDSIRCLGRVSDEKKMELMQRAHVLAVASVKEGWGLVVTEANSQGTPAVVYDVDGLRDAVRDGETGLVCSENTPEGLAEGLVELLGDGGRYEKIREAAWRFSLEVNFERSYEGFKILF